ncbi:FAD-dependent oxidoreductase [Sporomusa acidovorans]|uniref:Fumarate reductase flavoprotein subunit n=1 Tax=Sporomusa acidovorans (strain ATCC 49682 / DSM 3132 / Mol) TaxID=1123286 RepID=A0ABZ3J0C3_SPOA4|nr:FAD-dependent oxidoreductase [Sporomusa acidovorans]OZC21339.1 fumarate reductase flavoprotein subunit precursor [Sporomusa acidovorans DSM 3132]SDE56894.1 Tat (twin-arginine translocation) pathway signal sequence [Sporomusa acidovorans]
MMSSDKKTFKGISRRDFFKGSALTVAGIAAGGLLVGCGKPKQEAAQTQAEKLRKYSWETPPAPIPASQIKETIQADVVVVGSGLAGLSAALRAAENGAKVAVLEKNTTWTGRGGHFGVAESREMKKAGLVNDKKLLVRDWVARTGNRAKEELVWLFVNNSGGAMDWFLPKAEAAQLTPVLFTGYYKGPNYTEYPGTHLFRGGPMAKKGNPGADVSLVLYNEAVKLGVTFYFKTPGEQLVKEGDRVVGVVAKASDGYKRFNAAKGVILATGDIGGNQEMCEAYAPLALKANESQYIPVGMNTGDGHKMGMWAGGAMEDAPFATAIHPQAFSFLSYFFLFVNQQGKRFMNEDTWVQAKSLETMRQPEGPWAFSIYDAKWPEEVKASLPIGGGMFWDWMGHIHGEEWKPDMDQKFLQGYLEEGKKAWKADTLDELAGKIGVPADVFKATVARYNELAKTKEDTDFGKRPELLTTIEKPPFYANKFGGALLVVTAGLNVDTKLRVLDAKQNPIPGLYAVGNVSGGLYGVDYPTIIDGNSHGRALTWGYLAGKNVLEG